MTVKDIIMAALRLLDRVDLIEKVDEDILDGGEEQETVDTLVYCFNAVEDEIARRYIPLNTRESLCSSVHKFYYITFENLPIRIKKVFADGQEIPFSVFSEYMMADAEDIEVEYSYSPAKKDIYEDSDYGAEVGESLFAYGICAEYCLINGEYETSLKWEAKYRKQIDFLQSKLPVCGNIPPRRWT